MRLATWNVNGLRARLDFLLHWLAARQPDVVALQELKLTDDLFPRLELEAAGYQAVVYGQKSWNGVAVLSRGPVELEQAGLPGEEEFGSRLISARVPTPNSGDLIFTSVYCPNGKTVEHPDYQKKLGWYESLAAHLRAQHDPSRLEILGGDFNICPQPLDSWNEEASGIFHTDEERARFQAILDWGYVDLFREKYPSDQVFSWWDYRGGAFHRKRGLRIDFLLATRELLGKTSKVETDREYRKKKDGLTASDHAPVVADIEL